MMRNMVDDIGRIINDFKAARWEAKPYARVVALLTDNLTPADEVVRAIIVELQEDPTFLHFAIDCLPDSAFEALVPVALDAFSENPGNEASEDFISHASLQSVTSLHPHLSRIFELKPNWRAYYAQWPWRESRTRHLAFLKDRAMDNGERRNCRNAAILAMLETRDEEALAFVWHTFGKELSHDFLRVGFEGGDHDFRKLYFDKSFHLGFPADYFCRENVPVHLVKRNPTWHLRESDFSPATFGGDGNGDCQICGGMLHNIIALPNVPPGIGVTEMGALSLQTCLSCLGYEHEAGVLFYEHDELGFPCGINGSRQKVKPQFPAVPLKPARVTLCATPRRWAWQDWAVSNNRENLNRIGGFPGWVQGPDYLLCPKCKTRMSHLMQLDSELPTSDGQDWLWGSGGCCYVGWCDNCKASGFQWQCT